MDIEDFDIFAPQPGDANNDLQKPATEYVQVLDHSIEYLTKALQQNEEKIRLIQDTLFWNAEPDQVPKEYIFDSFTLQDGNNETPILPKVRNRPTLYHPHARRYNEKYHNRQFSWTPEKETTLQKYHKQGRDYEFISKKLKISPLECAKKMAEFHRTKGIRWIPEMDALLLHLVLTYGENQFPYISRKFNADPLIIEMKKQHQIHCDWNHNQLAYRWNTSVNPNLKIGSWSAEEDIRLVFAAKMLETDNTSFGHWSEFQKFIPHRSSVQLRERLARLQKNQVDIPYSRAIRTVFTGQVKVEKVGDDLDLMPTNSIDIKSLRAKTSSKKKKKKKSKIIKKAKAASKKKCSKKKHAKYQKIKIKKERVEKTTTSRKSKKKKSFQPKKKALQKKKKSSQKKKKKKRNIKKCRRRMN